MLDLEMLEAETARLLTPMAYDYFRGGADDETTLADNGPAWARVRLRPHVLRDVSEISTQTTALGAPVGTPVGVAPTAYHLLAHPDGECGTASASARAGAVFTLSSFATQPLEEVAAASDSGRGADGAPRWFQTYVDPDRSFTAALARRAAAAGYGALVLTADAPVLGQRRRDERNGFALPAPLHLAHQPPERTAAFHRRAGDGAAELPGTPRSALARHAQQHMDAGLRPDDIDWLAQVSGLPVVVKGVLRGDDALACLAAGAAAIWVSNHGGRQLDGAIATADALPEVVAAVGPDTEVYVDGGIRSGTDVLRALALGARMVFVGRPPVYGLAVQGSAGVEAVLAGLTEELARAMALCGVRAPEQVTADLLASAGPWAAAGRVTWSQTGPAGDDRG